MTKSKKSQRMIMILALSAIQVMTLSILYRIINPKEFVSMIYQVSTNNEIRYHIRDIVYLHSEHDKLVSFGVCIRFFEE